MHTTGFCSADWLSLIDDYHKNALTVRGIKQEDFFAIITVRISLIISEEEDLKQMLPLMYHSITHAHAQESFRKIVIPLITPCACTRGKVIGFVCLSVCLSAQNSPDLEI